MTAIDTTTVARMVLARAMDHHRAGRLTEAEADYRAVAALGYRRHDMMRLIAGLATETGRLDEALAGWRELLRELPDDVPALRAVGTILRRLGRWDEAVAAFAAAAGLAPDDLSLATSLGVALHDAGRDDEALSVLRRAAASFPEEPVVRHKLRQVVQATVPSWHVPMINDAPRNLAFAAAIARAVAARGPGARVLDIGTGSGILSLLAVRAGAAAVVACEAVPGIAELAQEIVAANRAADRVSVIAKKSTELEVGRELAAPADILVSEILSSSVLSEGVLATFEDARARLLKPDAAIIPRAVTAVGCLAGGEALERMAFVGRVEGLDLSAFTALAPPRLPLFGRSPPWTRLSDDADLLHFDLARGGNEPDFGGVPLRVTADGLAVGVVQWMRVELDEETMFVNPPESYEAGGWQQVLHTFAAPVRVRAGEEFILWAGHDRVSLIFAPPAKSK